MNKKTVELKAIQLIVEYEWECPNCYYENNENIYDVTEIKFYDTEEEEVQCQNEECLKKFIIEGINYE